MMEMMQGLVISPHNDDETLFTAYTLMNENVNLIVVYDSYVQVNRGYAYCDMMSRRLETIRALKVLGVMRDPTFLHLSDVSVGDDAVSEALAPFLHWCKGMIYYPMWSPLGNRHHNAVAEAVMKHPRPTHMSVAYATYTSEGKQITEHRVHGTEQQRALKKQALQCYVSQLRCPETRPHFVRDDVLEEYLECPTSR